MPSASHVAIRDYVVRLLEADQAFPPRHRWLDAVLARPPIRSGGSTAEQLARDRSERDEALADRTHTS
jgi:hypothetical protein